MKKILTAIVCAAFLGLGVASVGATPIDLGANARYLGSVDPGTPANAATEVAFINFLLGMDPGATYNDPDPPRYYEYVRSSEVFVGLPVATTAGARSNVDATGGATFDATGFTYLLAKFGNTSYVWVLNTSAPEVTITLPSSLPGMTGSGLSHYSLYNYVPDGGATLILLGSGLVGLGVLRRKFNV